MARLSARREAKTKKTGRKAYRRGMTKTMADWMRAPSNSQVERLKFSRMAYADRVDLLGRRYCDLGLLLSAGRKLLNAILLGWKAIADYYLY